MSKVKTDVENETSEQLNEETTNAEVQEEAGSPAPEKETAKTARKKNAVAPPCKIGGGVCC